MLFTHGSKKITTVPHLTITKLTKRDRSLSTPALPLTLPLIHTLPCSRFKIPRKCLQIKREKEQAAIGAAVEERHLRGGELRALAGGLRGCFDCVRSLSGARG